MDQNYASHEEEPPFENENNKLPKIPILTIPIAPTTYNLCNALAFFKKLDLSGKGYNIYTIYARQEHFVLKMRLQNQPDK